MKSLPVIKQSFIDKYIEQYNKGNIIIECLVEYEEVLLNQDIPDFITKEAVYDTLILKLDKDGRIIIHKIQDTFTREEMKEIVLSSAKFGWDAAKSNIDIGIMPANTENWLNKNY